MKVLILCNDFPPLNSIGAERPYSWFKYFKENGIEPIVITKHWISEVANPIDALNNINDKKVFEDYELGDVIRVPHSFILSEKIIKKYGILRFIKYRKFITFIYKFLSFHSFYFDQHKYIYKEAVTYLKYNKVDVVITTGEPFILFKYGMKLKKRFDVKWIADYRDGWYLNHVTSISSNFLIKILRWNEFRCERKYMKYVDVISTTDPILTRKLGTLFHKKSILIYNGFWNFYEKTTHDKESSKLVLTHTGTLTPGQRIEFLLQAVKELLDENRISENDIEIRLIGLDYYIEQKERVYSYSENLRNIIVTSERVPHKEAIQYNLNSDFLLTFTEEVNSTIFAKTYTYIACKKQILVIPDDNSILGNLVKENSLGQTFQNINELKEFLFVKIQEKKERNITNRY